MYCDDTLIFSAITDRLACVVHASEASTGRVSLVADRGAFGQVAWLEKPASHINGQALPKLRDLNKDEV